MTLYIACAAPSGGSLPPVSGPSISNQRPKSMLDLPERANFASPLLASAGTLGVHFLVLALAALAGTRAVQHRAPALVSELTLVELAPVELPTEITPEPEPAPPPKAESVKPLHVPTPLRPAAQEAARPAPPPAAAAAAQVLAANDDVVDFKDTLVAGNGTHYAGGVTSQSGTSTQAVRDSRARGDGVMGGTGNGSAPSVDLSRPPALAGGSDWDCPFPFEAEDRGIDQAVVALRVEVAASGDVIAAKVARDPGAGFGREAQRCALRKRWSPGLDRAGKPTSAVAQVNVRFRQ